MKNSMMLINSEWEGRKTFRLIPTDINCPFVEGILDPETNTLVMFSKSQKDGFHMIPKLDDNGDPVMIKGAKPRFNGKTYREERRTLATFHEYYLTNIDDIDNFVKMFCENVDTFDYSTYLEPAL
jgi:hypothetical protein